MKDAEKIAALELRVAALERQKAMAAHVHDYVYSKSMHGTPGGFGGVSTSWSWKCLGPDAAMSKVCPQPSGGTNHPGGIPEHFPDALR